MTGNGFHNGLRGITRLLAFVVLVALAGCSDSDSDSDSNDQTLFGAGAFNTSAEAARAIVDQLSAPSLTRDSTQLPPQGQEFTALNHSDQQRAGQSTRSTRDLDKIIRLLESVGIPTSLFVIVETDMRLNPVVGQAVGGHAGHSYVAVDGKFVDMLDEIANYYAREEFGSTAVSPQSAIDNIVAYHNLTRGSSSPITCCFPSSGLTNAERERADVIRDSLVGAIFYHEFAHYYLMHSLDRIRSSFDPTGIVLFSSVAEDDADFIAGALSAKAGLEPDWGKFMYDLMMFYSAQRQGTLNSIIAVTNSAVVQQGTGSQSHSTLAVRKANYDRGYAAF